MEAEVYNPQEEYIADIIPEGPYSVYTSLEVENESEVLRYTFETQESVFAPQYRVPYEVLLEWYQKCPNSFTVVKGENGVMKGAITILPMKDDSYKKVKYGELGETEIVKEDLFTIEEKKQVKKVYIDNIMTPKNSLLVLIAIIKNMSSLLEQIADLEKIEEIGTTTVSENSTRLATELGFTIVREKEKRKDGMPFYCVKFR